MEQTWYRTVVLLGLLLLSPIEGSIDRRTLQCRPSFFVPFTFSGVTRTLLSRGPQSTGFSHMAASWMAMEHFNRRDVSIVPELGGTFFQDCNVTFRLEGSENQSGATFFDSSSGGHQAGQLLYEHSRGGDLSCAFIGPSEDSSALSISTLAASIGVPHIPHGGQDVRLSESLLNPFTSVIYPRIMDLNSALARFLLVHGRTNYIAALFAYTETGIQVQEGIEIALDLVSVTQRRSFGYISPTRPAPIPGQSILEVAWKIKASGYRTIVVTMDNEIYDLPKIADAAEQCGLNSEDYLWIFLPPFTVDSVQALIDFPESLRKNINPPLPLFANVKKLLIGAALLHPVDGFQVDPDNDKFAKAWQSVDELFVERLNSHATVVTPAGIYNAEAYEPTTLEYFRKNLPEQGSSYIFDATMAVGMGACIAERQLQMDGLDSDSISGQELVKGIQATNFSGASGHVEFGVSLGLSGNVTGSRNADFMTIGVFNLFPSTKADNNEGSKGFDSMHTLTATYTNLLDRGELRAIISGADIDQFFQVDEYHPFYFRDGTIMPPALLRDPADQNYLSPALRCIGISSMVLSLSCCLAFGVWALVYREHRILKASQPRFLYLLIFGAALSSLSIFGISTDENWGYTADQLGRHCMSIVWLASVGHIVTYGALFAKLWRVNQVLQFSRRKINASHVAWPSALLMLAALTILTVWQIVEPLRWVRVELDEVTGESIGHCDSETLGYFIAALATVMIIPSILTCLMAWKTRDVDDSFSEHAWIFTLVVIQLQVIFVAIPLVIVLQDISTDGKYIGLLVLLWSMPMSTILLIMLPKVVAFYQRGQGMERSARVRGSSGAGLRITGLPASNTQSVQRASDGSRITPANPKTNHRASHSDGSEFAVE